MADKDVKCSDCDVPAQVILEEGQPQNVVCPQCGVEESYEDFQQSALDQASVYARNVVGKSLKGMARKNKEFRYEPGNIRPFNPRFRVDLAG